MNEYVFQCGFRNGDRVDLTREGLNHIGNETVSPFSLQTNFPVEHARINPVALLNSLRQRFWIVGFQKDHVSADLALQFRGCSDRNKPSLA